MTRIAYLVTSAREMTLADGSQHPTGYFAEEALKPYERFVAAGFDVTVITPDGNPPYADPYGLSWFFNYPEEDKDYLASVVRTFARDVDDIRLTLHQNTELGLAASRRLAALLQAPQVQAARAQGVEDHHRSLRAVVRRVAAQRRLRRLAHESGGLQSDFDRASFLLGKQLMYFERYGKLFMADVPLMKDRDFFVELLAGVERP